MIDFISRFTQRWNGDTHGAGLAVTRWIVSLAILLEMWYVWSVDGVNELIVEPETTFQYPLFGWLGKPQGLMPYVLVLFIAGMAISVFLGWRTRVTAWLLALSYGYWFLFDASNYSDHRYLTVLLTILLAWLPCHRWLSVDRYAGREKSDLVPAWTVELVRLQLVITFFYFGSSLLSRDWLAGAPLIAWAATDPEAFPFAWFNTRPELLTGLAWLFPTVFLLAIPALYWNKSRWFALGCLAGLQIFDAVSYEVSVSAWMLAVLPVIFCDASFLQSVGDRIRRWISRIRIFAPIGALLTRLGSLIDNMVSWFDDTPLWGRPKSQPTASAVPGHAPHLMMHLTSWLVAGWIFLQAVLPVRHLLIETRPDWTDLATMFAWRGQHIDKQCTLKLSVIQPSQELRWPLDPTDEFPIPLAMFYTEEYLDSQGLSEGVLKDLISGPVETRLARVKMGGMTDAQAQKVLGQLLTNFNDTERLRLSTHQYEQMVQRPELLRQYAFKIGEQLKRLLKEDIQVHAELIVKLNHRPAQTMLSDDPENDLLDCLTIQDLVLRLEPLKNALPAVADRIAAARTWAEQRRLELEQDYDIVSGKNPNLPGEPIKLPPLSEEDERLLQEKFGQKS